MQLSRYHRELGEIEEARRYAILRNVSDPLSAAPRLERRAALEHLVQQAPERPAVHGRAVGLGRAQQQLRRRVVHRARLSRRPRHTWRWHAFLDARRGVKAKVLETSLDAAPREATLGQVLSGRKS